MMKSKKAYTLVELLVSLAIFTVVIGSLMSILISQNAFFSRASAAVDVGSKARKVMTLMLKEIRLSRAVTVRDVNGNLFGQTNPNGVSILFQVPVDIDSDGDKFSEWGEIEWGCEGGSEWSIEYYYDSVNQRVMRRLWDASGIAQSETVIAENISNFLIQGFSYNATSMVYELNSVCAIIEITVTAERDSIAGRDLANPLSYTLTNRVRCRNN